MVNKSVAYLSIGSNLGQREANLAGGLEGLRQAGIVIRGVSPVFETEPVGCPDQPWYLNIAADVETALTPHALLMTCLAIEASHGRARRFPGAPRTLDLDILIYDDQVIDEPSLTIPHPRMAHRRFVLEPLALIAPEAIHPVLRVTVRDLLTLCRDESRVRFYCDALPGKPMP